MPASEVAGALVDAKLGDLSAAIRQAFEGLLEGIDPGEVLGFAVFSDIDGADLTAAVNTRADLASNLAHYSDPEFAEGAGEDFNWERYLRWAPGEWRRSSLDVAPEAAEPMRKVWGEIKALQDQAPKRDRKYWPSIQYQAAWIALGLALEEGWFARYPDAVLVFAVQDGDETPQEVADWLGPLNPERWDEVQAYIANEL